MKKTKIIIPALAVLLLSTAASVSGTVAWFSMNNSVKVDGMTVTTRVSSNLLIAETNEEANYSDAINQSRAGVLEPASTINGEDFFYTVNAKGDGSAKAPTAQGDHKYKEYSEANVANPSNALDHAAAGKDHYDAAFNSSYGIEQAQITTSNVVYAYMDYSFFIKATSAADDQVLYMSKCNLTYRNAGDTAWENISAQNNGGLAWRVGLLAYDTSANTPANDSQLALKTIIGLDGAFNQNQKGTEVVTTGFEDGVTDVSTYYLDQFGKTPASGTYDEDSGTKLYNAPSQTAQAVDSVDTLDDVEEANEPAQAATGIDLGVTSYTRIVVRLWLEGEDISCTSATYAELTRNWRLTLEFKLGNADDGAAQDPVANGVTQISSDYTKDLED